MTSKPIRARQTTAITKKFRGQEVQKDYNQCMHASNKKLQHPNSPAASGVSCVASILLDLNPATNCALLHYELVASENGLKLSGISGHSQDGLKVMS